MSVEPSLNDMHAYWEGRAPFYLTDDVFGRNILRAYISKLQPKPESLIEIGCGNGELIMLYKDIPRVTLLDWSEVMLRRCNLRKSRHYLPNMQTLHHDICNCSPTGHWDVAVTRTVLMHIPSKHVEKAVRHIVKIADQFLIFEYFESVLLHKLAAHCWLHDYVPMFEAAGCKLVEVYSRPDSPQMLFHFKKV